MTDIRAAQWPEDLATAQTLFHEYAGMLGVDLEFQGFEAEVAQLPGKYVQPAGRLLLAWQGTEAVGCVCLRPLNGNACEMKRLYVRPQARGEQLGYSRICLDTLPTMASAQRIYESLGFKPIEPYVFNPVAGTKFLALDL
jgi:GNAT superfamily N-acetyltransferase